MLENINSAVGIVIDNQDFTNDGKLLVYFPSLDNTPSGLINKGKMSYIFPGDDNEGDLKLSDIESIKQRATWCFVMQPLFGGSSMGKVDIESGKTTTSEVALNDEDFNYKDKVGALPESSNYNHFGAISDAFSNPSARLVRRGNYTGYDYFPENYSGAPNGLFSTVDIGTRVVTIFPNNNKNYGIIIGKLPYSREINLINL